MRRAILVLIIISAACGGSSSPTQPAPQPIPAANIVTDGGASWSFTPFATSALFHETMKNTGVGCAQNVRGVVKFFDQGGAQLGTSYNWSAPINITTVRPSESFSYESGLIPIFVSSGSKTYKSEPAWDNVRCP